MNFPKLIPHLAAIATFFAVVVYFFGPQFSGKILANGDIDAFRGSANETYRYRQQTGEAALWTGSSFGGMPTYQVHPAPSGNQLARVRGVFWAFMERPAGYFFGGMLFCYVLLVVLGVNPWWSIVGALAAGLATNGFVLFKAGHMTKLLTVFYLPVVTLGILLAFRRRYAWGGLVFALGMGLSLLANHPQMLYYFGLTLPFFGVARLVYDLRRGQALHFVKATGVLVVGLLLAIGSSATTLWTTQEYAAETTRGGQKLTQPVRTPKDASGTSTADGLSWDYAMRWSNGLPDLLATYAPLAAGGGKGTTVERGSAFGKALVRGGRRLPARVVAPTYHGALPFTEGPTYLGAVVWALFLFGLFTARRSLAVWLGAGVLLMLLISLGKNFAALNQLLYDHLPLFSAFRAHSSALSIATFLMVLLGVLGVHHWSQLLDTDAGRARKQLLYAGVTAVVAGLAVIFVLPAFLSFSNPTDEETITRMARGTVNDMPALLEGLWATRRSLYATDAWRSFLYVGLSFGTLFLVYRRSLPRVAGAVVLAALVLADFAAVNSKVIDRTDWGRPRATIENFALTAADQTILADPDPHFRVLNATVNPFDESTTSYHHKSIGGYSAVKLRRTEDVINAFLTRNEADYDYNYPEASRQQLYNMFNVKYLIADGGNGTQTAQLNQEAFGPAWLVREIRRVGSNDEEFRALAEASDLRTTAVVHEEFADVIAGLDPTGGGTVSLTEYTPDRLTYAFRSNAEQFVVFSEMWYGPDLGWTLTVDGEPTELVRANYLLRGARVPAGQHTLVMEFRPRSYYTGKTLATICSLLIVLGILGYGGYQLYQMRRKTA